MASQDIIGVPPRTTGKIGPGSVCLLFILVAMETTTECFGVFVVFQSNAMCLHSQMMHI